MSTLKTTTNNIIINYTIPFMSLGPGFTDGVTNTVYPFNNLLDRALASDSLSLKLYFLSASLSTIKNSFTSKTKYKMYLVIHLT